uniref:Uncharacterized protein n=1 Tax=Brugia malayi TaxID=6279 RepID=A0A5S6PDL0_BRUMA
MMVRFSALLLLLASCSAISSSNNQNQIKRPSNQFLIPYWRLLQRNRKVMYHRTSYHGCP